MDPIDELRAALGGVHPAAATKVKDRLDQYHRAFITKAPFLVMASANAAGDCDSTPRGGLPGFVKVIDDQTLLLPDVGGNRLFQSHENFQSNSKAGFLFIIPGINVTTRVNGRVRRISADEVRQVVPAPELHWADTNSLLVQGLMIEIDEAYFHCPRSFQFADLWNSETQQANGRLSLKDLLAG